MIVDTTAQQEMTNLAICRQAYKCGMPFDDWMVQRSYKALKLESSRKLIDKLYETGYDEVQYGTKKDG